MGQLLLSLMIAPYAEHSFLLEAIRKLYVARTSLESLFEKPVSDKHMERKAKKRKLAKKLTKEQRQKLREMHIPKVSACKSFVLFW